MRREWDEARLREAFRALSESEGVGEGDVDTLKVWQAVAGELSPEERLEVIDKVALEPGYAEAWRLATELFEASGGSISSPVPEARGESRRACECTLSWSPYVLAAAAVLVVGLLGVLVSQRTPPDEPVYRGGVVVPLTGAEESLPRNDFRLRWQAPGGRAIRHPGDDRGPSHPRHRFGSLVAGVRGSRGDDWKSFLAGAKVLWQVEATLPDGSVVQSGTFITEVK